MANGKLLDTFELPFSSHTFFPFGGKNVKTGADVDSELEFVTESNPVIFFSDRRDATLDLSNIPSFFSPNERINCAAEI